MTLIALILALAFALIHLFIGRMHVLSVTPRSRWLSAAGGVAVAYVFLHLLPELAAHQETFAEGLGVDERTAESWVYLVALLGLAAFYGVERLAKESRARARAAGAEDAVETRVFWIHIASFAAYNLLIGYLLLHREETGWTSLVFYFIAMALHFLTNDFGLHDDHKTAYDRKARWVLAAAVLGGWGLGVLATLPPLAIGLLFAFLAGGVVLNVLKEELPEDRKSDFGAFALGTAAYAALLLLI